jgi:hypothetical protein
VLGFRVNNDKVGDRLLDTSNFIFPLSLGRIFQPIRQEIFNFVL